MDLVQLTKFIAATYYLNMTFKNLKHKIIKIKDTKHVQDFMISYLYYLLHHLESWINN
jgi:hypothetical protein